jgi:hypothetical protein
MLVHKHSTQGEDEEGGDNHALHCEQMQGGQRDEAPIGQETKHDFPGGGQYIQDSIAISLYLSTSVRISFFVLPSSAQASSQA